MRTRLRRAVAVVGVVIAATVAASTIGVGQANALTGWTPYTVIAETRAAVGSVGVSVQIRRGTALNRYYTKVTCDNSNPWYTTVRINGGTAYSANINAYLGGVPGGPWGNPTVVGYSDPFVAFNDYLKVTGSCQYYYNGHYGWVSTPWSAWVWVGLWTG